DEGHDDEHDPGHCALIGEIEPAPRYEEPDQCAEKDRHQQDAEGPDGLKRGANEDDPGDEKRETRHHLDGRNRWKVSRKPMNEGVAGRVERDEHQQECQQESHHHADESEIFHVGCAVGPPERSERILPMRGRGVIWINIQVRSKVLAFMAASSFERLNEMQRRAVEHGHARPAKSGWESGPLLIVAGAGTGKTNTLAHRVAWLVLAGVEPDRILLLTFTRRASQEMTRRAQRIVDASLRERA